MAHLAALALVIAWNLLVLGFCSYVVFWLDRSGWWFALALVLMASLRDNR